MPPLEREVPLDDDPLWYKDAIIYQLHVRAFCDGNDDGVGDFVGLSSKLDYLQDLGVTGLWLQPFYPSPLRDDGYDIADYHSVHPTYGTLRDFREFLREAHRRGMRVITELVMNHTSDQHQWFQKARRAKPGSRWRDFYVWSDTADRYRDARIIFKDFETSNWAWDPVANAYYWHRFYSHQPDLNYDNPEVQQAMLRVMDFWLGMGVDGMRIDAVPYLYEREGTSCENLPETHAYLKRVRAHMDAKWPGRMLLAEANQWPEDAVAYFGQGDECNMAFHFPLMPRMFMALRMEDRYPIIDILDQTPPIHPAAQWAIFLRNHDELTLEMVTDEERDYMYRVYANEVEARINLGIRRRLAPLLNNNRRAIELMNSLLFALHGTPVVYYGDEIGMGDNIFLGDRNGVRTPMQWSADRNGGFSRANPQRLYLPTIVDPEYHFLSINVEAQQGNHNSLLWWQRQLIALRKRYRAFGRGSLEFLLPENRKVLALVRRYEDETILVVANLARHVQQVELDLSAWRGRQPIEMFGRTRFKAIGDEPYACTLGPYGVLWLSVEPPPGALAEVPSGTEARLPIVAAGGPAAALMSGRSRTAIEKLLPEWLLASRWFASKARTLEQVQIADVIEVAGGERPQWLVLVHVTYVETEPESYVLPLAVRPLREDQESARPEDVVPGLPAGGAVARVRVRGGGFGLLYDAAFDGDFAHALLDVVAKRRRLQGHRGELVGHRTSAFRLLARDSAVKALEPSVLRGEQSNTSIAFGQELILKLYRKVDAGVNPELEIGRYLTEKARFSNFPALAGALELAPARGEAMTLGVVQQFVPNQGDAWRFTLESLANFYAEMVAQSGAPPVFEPVASLAQLSELPVPAEIAQHMNYYLALIEVLGRRTAEMHLALAGDGEDPTFTRESMTPHWQRGLYQSMRNQQRRVVLDLRKVMRRLPEPVQELAKRVLEHEEAIGKSFRAVLERKLTGKRIRVHGDYHLGQVLYTGSDFVIIDFEGEPARALSERRIRRSPLRDVAGMLRSFHYAAFMALQRRAASMPQRPEEAAVLEGWGRAWQLATSVTFLRRWLEHAAAGEFLPETRDELDVLLRAYLLEKALYEVGYEMNNRPDWLHVPLRGVLQLVEGAV